MVTSFGNWRLTAIIFSVAAKSLGDPPWKRFDLESIAGMYVGVDAA